MSKESILKIKSFDFAVRIIKLYRYLRKTYHEYELSQQILRSGTSVGAIVREAKHAESRKDFLHKLNIGLKEINECNYWLDLLIATDFVSQRMYDSIKQDAVELLKILIASIKTTKARIDVSK
ncbi:MAG: four helix bundle protein [Chitinophagales bacterium]